ncbi:hypothetical protein NE237_011307 [Protea cynaroides]|uniref:Uncharacterized protein n=1 Tax=Protea cynaroides TaxID=273540 RepID=A0A9Q0GVT9_9MAGN|nr:hypothetical protein NE237_011307 [Protea cynaroides]
MGVVVGSNRTETATFVRNFESCGERSSSVCQPEFFCLEDLEVRGEGFDLIEELFILKKRSSLSSMDTVAAVGGGGGGARVEEEEEQAAKSQLLRVPLFKSRA